MEKRDRTIAFLFGVAVACCAVIFKLDYLRIAESGLTLSSIVLAVYIAAIIGLINSDLAKKMQKTPDAKQKDRTQLGVLTRYFKLASLCSIATIVISSIMLLIPPAMLTFPVVVSYVWPAVSTIGIVVYAENLAFLAMIIRFMLNRQIWNN